MHLTVFSIAGFQEHQQMIDTTSSGIFSLCLKICIYSTIISKGCILSGNTIIAFLHIFVLLLCHGDIDPNPGTKKPKKNHPSNCHWNLNSLSAIADLNTSQYLL